MKLFGSFFRSERASVEEYAQAAHTVDAFLAGTGGVWDWDDFTSVRKRDPFLESVRARCIEVRDKYPPVSPTAYCNEQGFAALRALADEVRAKQRAIGR